MERLLYPKEVAKVLGISEYALLYGSLNGVIPKVKILNKTRYKEQDVKNYISKNTERITCIKE